MDRSKPTLRGFLRVLWLPLVAALPVAALFGTLSWLGWLGYWVGYKITLIFAYPIALLVWLTNSFLVPRLTTPAMSRKQRIWLAEILPTAFSSIVGALVGVAIVEGMQRGSIGDVLSVAQVLLFTLYFVALAVATSYAVSFHRDSVERARTEGELRSARQLQHTLFEHASHEGLGLDLHAKIVPSRQVSGDFYTVIPTGDGSFVIAVVDVAGKRMPAALVASMLLASLRTQSATRTSVAEIVTQINQLACRGRITEERLFATMFVARFDPRTMRLSFTNAGHRHPVVFRRSGDPVTLEKGGSVIGMSESFSYVEDSIVLQSGDRLVIYSDGAAEAENRRGEMFGQDRLLGLVRSASVGRQSLSIVDDVLANLREFQERAEARDDIMLMVLQVPA